MSKLKESVESDQTKHLSEEAVLLTVEEVKEVFVNIDEIHTSEMFKVLTEPVGDMPVGVVVQLDPIDQFNADIMDCPDGVKKVLTIVAAMTKGLRVIFPKVNGSSGMVEVVLDTGSQIISMDMQIAKSLDLTWDPNTVICMQSSNSGLNSMQGLARNVPFKFGEIVLYLQVHIVNGALYQVLLGRPFNTLANTKVLNNGEDTKLELTCPNTKRRVTLPMFKQGLYWPAQHEDVKPIVEEPESPQMEEEEEVALQFELTETSEVVLMGYKLPSTGKQFHPEELAEAYVMALYMGDGNENSESNRLIQQFLMGAKV
uniref:Aspartic peptidase DDI1-type domain-containing protein n=1 Tax=Moniliophthora roreri TaxID=221103 RepID=A0A0W0GFI4_MONRR